MAAAGDERWIACRISSPRIDRARARNDKDDQVLVYVLHSREWIEIRSDEIDVRYWTLERRVLSVCGCRREGTAQAMSGKASCELQLFGW